MYLKTNINNLNKGLLLGDGIASSTLECIIIKSNKNDDKNSIFKDAKIDFFKSLFIVKTSCKYFY